MTCCGKGIPEPMDVSVSVIIVSYNTADLIGSCLSSLEQTTNPDKREIFVVDNASSDGSAEIIQQSFPGVHLIANQDNKGFAAANNQALRLCRGGFIFFLNPDTQVMPDALEKAVTYMQNHADIGLAGTKILNPDGTLQESVSYRYPGEKYTHGDLPPLKGKIACVLGAAMISRREVIDAVGGFDEDFFLYGEDEDLCLRIRKAGMEIGYIEETAVLHLGGQSERGTVSEDKWRKKVRAEYLFYRKHYSPETVQRIKRADWLKAHWRLLSLGITLPFLKERTRTLEKQGRYRVILEEASRKINR